MDLLDKKEKSKNWTSRYKLSNVYISLFLSFFLSLTFLFLDKFLKSPVKKIFPELEAETFFNLESFFFVNFLVSFFQPLFYFFDKYFLSNNPSFSFLKILRPIIYSIKCIISSKIYSSIKPLKKTHFFYFLILNFFIHFSVYFSIDIFAFLIEKQGMFNGYNLIFLLRNFFGISALLLRNLNVFDFSRLNFNNIEKFSLSSIRTKDYRDIFYSLFLFSLIQIFVFFSYVKLEIPIESNKFSFYKDQNSYYFSGLNLSDEEKVKFDISFKMDIQNILGFIFFLNVINSFFSYFYNIEEFIFSKQSFKFFSEDILSKNLFFTKLNQKNFLISSLFLFFVSLSNVCRDFFYSKEISSHLAKKGVFFDSISLGNDTKWFLFKKLAKISLFKDFFLFLMILFYDLFSFNFLESTNPSSISLFIFISNLTDIFDQIISYRKCMNFYD